jgi:hypothetical protein
MRKSPGMRIPGGRPGRANEIVGFRTLCGAPQSVGVHAFNTTSANQRSAFFVSLCPAFRTRFSETLIVIGAVKDWLIYVQAIKNRQHKALTWLVSMVNMSKT